MKILLQRITFLLATRLDEIQRRRRIRSLRHESEDIFREAMGRVVSHKTNGGNLIEDSIDDEIYSI